ncbi:YcxB family protein [Inquilinus limosus]|uniref:YcxB family protein n=1 Tax=Inquilinus limosus TaxID=171674 RepID=UPI003F1556AC
MSVSRSVTISATVDDYIKAQRLHLMKQYRKPAVLAAIAMFSIMYILFLLVILAGPRRSYDAAPYVHVLFTALLASPVVNYFFISPFISRRNFRRQKTLHRPTTLIWSEAGLETKNETGEWLLPWSDYYKWAENAHMLLLYVGPNLFQFVPKRWLTADQVVDLRRCAAVLSAPAKVTRPTPRQGR